MEEVGDLWEGRRGDRKVDLLGKKTWRGKLHLLQLHVHLLYVGGGLHDLVVLKVLQDALVYRSVGEGPVLGAGCRDSYELGRE